MTITWSSTESMTSSCPSHTSRPGSQDPCDPFVVCFEHTRLKGSALCETAVVSEWLTGVSWPLAGFTAGPSKSETHHQPLNTVYDQTDDPPGGEGRRWGGGGDFLREIIILHEK